MINKESELIKKLDKVIELLEKKEDQTKIMLQEYISEEEAKQALNFGTTWFWNLRKNGFPHSKLGNKVFYKKADFEMYLEKRSL